MNKVIVVDDDITQITLVKTILCKVGYEVKTYTSPITLLNEYVPEEADILLSDINMPELPGKELVEKIRKVDLSTPIIMFTATSNIKSIVEYFKLGISDYIIKPLVPEDLIHRVNFIITNSEKMKKFHKIQVEKELIELENHKLINWKNLYASKDITQTRQMMNFFTRTINSGGGYLWLDFLKKKKPNDNGDYLIDHDLYNLIVEAASSQRKSFEFMSYLSNLPELNIVEYRVDTFIHDISEYLKEVIHPFIFKNKKDLSVNINTLNKTGNITVDIEIIKNILWELFINAIKYSPDIAKILVEMYIGTSEAHNNQDSIVIKIRNIPRYESGISYDYSELVFNLFYTMESCSIDHKEEKWSNGTGLYISREFLKRMGGWITCCNMVDYTEQNKGSYVEFKIVLPIK